MLTDADRKKAAQLLLTAERDRKPIVQLSATWPSITLEDAYAIQNEVQRQKMAEGRKLIGHKVGLTSKAMQQSSQINEPDYGHLLDDMMIADGARVPHANYCAPRVEDGELLESVRRRIAARMPPSATEKRRAC